MHLLYEFSVFKLQPIDEFNLAEGINSYIHGFSVNVQEIFNNFKFDITIQKLLQKRVLNIVHKHFSALDLTKKSISNQEISFLFNDLIYHFAESNSEITSEHITPPDILNLATALIFSDDKVKNNPDTGFSLYDPASGMGGFLFTGIEYANEINLKSNIQVFGQDINTEITAISQARMLISGEDTRNIRLGNTLTNDMFPECKFDYMLSNAPFGLNWKNIAIEIKNEHETLGLDGRFGIGLPRISDSSMLFLLHLISKLKNKSDGGGRIGIILNSSALWNGTAGSGESEIRRYILESDLLETIVALPSNLFYNTGISTYLWILSNNKEESKKGKLQIIDAIKLFGERKKVRGSKQNIIKKDDLEKITQTFRDYKADENCNSVVYDTADFGYRRITIEQSLRLQFTVNADNLTKYAKIKSAKYLDELSSINQGDSFKSLPDLLEASNIHDIGKKEFQLITKCFSSTQVDADIASDFEGNALPDISKRKYENVPLNQSINDYFKSEVLPYMPEAWVNETICDKKDKNVGIVGYEIDIDSIRLNKQIDRLETQYKNYKQENLGRLVIDMHRGSQAEQFEAHKNAIYVSQRGISEQVFSDLNELKGDSKNYIQLILHPKAINRYLVSFFKSELGVLSLKTAMKGNVLPFVSLERLDKVVVALPSPTEQKNIVDTLLKVETLRQSLDKFDDELALNPTSSQAILGQLDGMLERIGGLTESDKVRGIVREGETAKIEFKSSLSFDFETNKKSTVLETAVYKNVVAFLNSKGGTLLIGIDDGGNTIGIRDEVDRFYKGNNDKYLLYWKNKLKSRVGEQFYPFIETNIVDVDGLGVLKVDCKQSSEPCYLDNKDFYVRTNPATDKLEGPILVEYVNNHFSKS